MIKFGAEVKKQPVSRYKGYSKENYERRLKYRTQPISFNLKFIEAGLSKAAVEDAVEDLTFELGQKIAVNAWWNAAALLALKNPQAIKKILKGQK